MLVGVWVHHVCPGLGAIASFLGLHVDCACRGLGSSCMSCSLAPSLTWCHSLFFGLARGLNKLGF